MNFIDKLLGVFGLSWTGSYEEYYKSKSENVCYKVPLYNSYTLKRPKKEKRIICENDVYEKIVAESIQKRKENGAPQFTIGHIPMEAEWNSMLLNLHPACEIAWYAGDGGEAIPRYLIHPDNIETVYHDVSLLIEIANHFCESKNVHFRFPNVLISDFLWRPEFCVDEAFQSWRQCQMIPQPLTKAGKQPKYPLKIRLDTKNARKNFWFQSELYYTRDGDLAKAKIWCLGDIYYSADFLENEYLLEVKRLTVKNNTGKIIRTIDAADG